MSYGDDMGIRGLSDAALPHNKLFLHPCDKDGCDNIPELQVSATEDPEVDDIIKDLCWEHARTWVDFLLAHGIDIIEIAPSEYA